MCVHAAWLQLERKERAPAPGQLVRLVAQLSCLLLAPGCGPLPRGRNECSERAQRILQSAPRLVPSGKLPWPPHCCLVCLRFSLLERPSLTQGCNVAALPAAVSQASWFSRALIPVWHLVCCLLAGQAFLVVLSRTSPRESWEPAWALLCVVAVGCEQVAEHTNWSIPESKMWIVTELPRWIISVHTERSLV